MTLVCNYLLFVHHLFSEWYKYLFFFTIIWKCVITDIFDIVIDISSHPCDLHGSAALITLIISLFSNLIQEIVVFVICL